MDSKIVVSICASILIIGATVFVMVELVDEQLKIIKEVENETTDESLMASTSNDTGKRSPNEQLNVTNEEEIETTESPVESTPNGTDTRLSIPDGQPFVVITVPQICKRGEKLDPVTEECKRVF